MENEGDKGRRSFLRRGEGQGSITRKVLTVNVYLVCNSNGLGNYWKDVVCRFVDANPHPENRKVATAGRATRRFQNSREGLFGHSMSRQPQVPVLREKK